MASITEDAILQNMFNMYEGPRCHVILNQEGLAYRKLGYNKSNQDAEYERISTRDIVGCHCMRDRPKVNSSYRFSYSGDNNSRVQSRNDTDDPIDTCISSIYICFYCYPLKRKRYGKKLIRTRESLVFHVDCHKKTRENLALAEKWKNATKNLIRRPSINASMFNLSSRKLLIFVNPFSGPGRALQIFQQRVNPILAEAEIEHNLVVTDKGNHAKEYITNCVNLNYWDGIVIVSGDGLLFEVFNGLMEREDWEVAIKTPVGVVPGGSGNGLARTIGHALDEPYLENMVLTSSLNLISGRTKPMDLVRVETLNSSFYSFLSIGWGLLADIDIESEKLRALGEQRFALWSLARIIGLRSYEGRVSYLPASYDPSEVGATPLRTILTRSVTVHDAEKVETPVLSRANSMPCHLTHNDEDCVSETPIPSQQDETTVPSPPKSDFCNSTLPPLTEPVPISWTSVEDSFLVVYVAYQTHIGSDVFFAPSARLDDGIMWLLMVRKGASRTQLLSFMLSLESGEHTRCPFVDMIPVRAVRIEPFTTTGYMTVDGESIEYGPLQAEVLPSIARIMVR